MPYCTDCGREVTGKMLFCSQCGSKLIISEGGPKDDKTYDYTIEAESKKPEDTAGRGIRKSKLYKQWVEYASLPTEEIPPLKTPRGMPARGEGRKPYPNILYILLGAIIIILGIGLIFFFVELR